METREIPIWGRMGLRVSWRPGGPLGSGRLAPGELLENIRRNLSDPTPLWRAVGEVMRRSFRINFQQGGRPRWRPLQPSTVARKQRLLQAGMIPRRTRRGAIPRRLFQLDPATGERSFGAATILIQTGALRDSWCVVGARGHVEQQNGERFFIGSQLTIQRTLAPDRPIRHYHILTKRALAARGKGGAVMVRVPLARIHEEGAPRANIPARPVGLVQKEDLVLIRQAQIQWALTGKVTTSNG